MMRKCGLLFVLFAILLSGNIVFAAPVQYLSAAQIEDITKRAHSIKRGVPKQNAVQKLGSPTSDIPNSYTRDGRVFGSMLLWDYEQHAFRVLISQGNTEYGPDTVAYVEVYEYFPDAESRRIRWNQILKEFAARYGVGGTAHRYVLVNNNYSSRRPIRSSLSFLWELEPRRIFKVTWTSGGGPKQANLKDGTESAISKATYREYAIVYEFRQYDQDDYDRLLDEVALIDQKTKELLK